MFIIAFSFSALGIGWWLVSEIEINKKMTSPERFVLGMPVGWLIFYFAVFSIGTYRLDFLSMGSILGITFALGVAGWVRLYRDGEIGSILRSVRLAVRQPTDRLLFLLTMAIVVSTFLQGLAPPNDYDSLMYHLAVPKWDIENRVISHPWNLRLPHAFFPALTSHISHLAIAVSDGSAAQLAHGLFYIFGVIATGLLTLRIGFSVRIAMIAALLFSAIRMVVWQAGTAETDLPVGTLLTISLIILVHWRTEGGWRISILLGLFFSILALSKFHGFF